MISIPSVTPKPGEGGFFSQPPACHARSAYLAEITGGGSRRSFSKAGSRAKSDQLPAREWSRRDASDIDAQAGGPNERDASESKPVIPEFYSHHLSNVNTCVYEPSAFRVLANWPRAPMYLPVPPNMARTTGWPASNSPAVGG